MESGEIDDAGHQFLWQILWLMGPSKLVAISLSFSAPIEKTVLFPLGLRTKFAAINRCGDLQCFQYNSRFQR